MASIISTANPGVMNAVLGVHHRRGQQDSAQRADELFARLDSRGQGFLKKSDISNALNGDPQAAKRVSVIDIDTLFTRFDADGDGKLTRQEFGDSVKRLADQLSQHSRMLEARGSNGAPSSPEMQGFTKDELSAKLEDIGKVNGQDGQLLDALVQNFDQVDGNGDGRVDMSEVMQFAENGAGTTTAAGASANGGDTALAVDDQTQTMLKLMKLLQAYGANTHEQHRQTSALQAVTA